MSKVPQLVLTTAVSFFALLHRLLRRLQGDVLGLRRFDLLAAVGAGRGRSVESLSPPPREIRIAATTPTAITREDGEDDPALVGLAPPSARKPRGLTIERMPTPPLTPLAAAVLHVGRRRSGCWRSSAATATARSSSPASSRRPGCAGSIAPSGAVRAAAARVGLDPEGRVAFKAARRGALPYPDDLFDLVVVVDGRPPAGRDRPGAAPRRPPDPRPHAAARAAPAGCAAGSCAGAWRAAESSSVETRRRRRRQLLCRPPARRRRAAAAD